MNNDLIKTLINALPSGRVKSTQIEPYTHDYSSIEPVEPLAVVCPETEEDVAAVIKVANTFQTPIVVRGTGTGKTGGSVPVLGGIVMSLEKMTRILEIDSQNRVAVVEPGVVTGVLQKEVEKQGLFYPPDPASLNECTIGGNVAENAGGAECFKVWCDRRLCHRLRRFFCEWGAV